MKCENERQEIVEEEEKETYRHRETLSQITTHHRGRGGERGGGEMEDKQRGETDCLITINATETP